MRDWILRVLVFVALGLAVAVSHAGEKISVDCKKAPLAAIKDLAEAKEALWDEVCEYCGVDGLSVCPPEYGVILTADTTTDTNHTFHTGCRSVECIEDSIERLRAILLCAREREACEVREKERKDRVRAAERRIEILGKVCK